MTTPTHSIKSKNPWDLSRHPQTRTKLQMLREIFDIWLTIWNSPNQQKWVAKEWYVLDLFAGRGWYEDSEREVSGSPLIFLESILYKSKKLRENNVQIKLVLVEKNKSNFTKLKVKIQKFIENHPEIEEIVIPDFYQNDCNKISSEIIEKVKITSKNPVFLFIDPYGINIHKAIINKYLDLNNPLDIFFNYSKEGVIRTQGVALKNPQTSKGTKTVNSFESFIGQDVDYKTKKDLDLLRDYIDSLFVKKGYNVVGFDMKYPKRRDIIYYLLFASKNSIVTNTIVKNIYAKYKEKIDGPGLFGREFCLDTILSISPSNKIRKIQRKTLLYKTKVEYGNWTINHIVGCMHGCEFPCYARMMARKFGWVKDDKDWRKPRLAENALDLLDKEIPKYKKEIDFVHLSFMTDPFMYDFEKRDLVPEIKKLTLEIVGKLNEDGIKVTTLTKGFYPDEVINGGFLKNNEYGITLVSLNEKFKQKYEPFSAPYEIRISSLKKLHDAGLKTWVSLEPYPTPNLDEEAKNIEKLLSKVSFVNKVIFGKLNYNISSSSFLHNEDFYRQMSEKVIKFCKENNIEFHIKLGTPLSRDTTKNIFKN